MVFVGFSRLKCQQRELQRGLVAGSLGAAALAGALGKEGSLVATDLTFPFACSFAGMR